MGAAQQSPRRVTPRGSPGTEKTTGSKNEAETVSIFSERTEGEEDDVSDISKTAYATALLFRLAFAPTQVNSVLFETVKNRVEGSGVAQNVLSMITDQINDANVNSARNLLSGFEAYETVRTRFTGNRFFIPSLQESVKWEGLVDNVRVLRDQLTDPQQRAWAQIVYAAVNMAATAHTEFSKLKSNAQHLFERLSRCYQQDETRRTAKEEFYDLVQRLYNDNQINLFRIASVMVTSLTVPDFNEMFQPEPEDTGEGTGDDASSSAAPSPGPRPSSSSSSPDDGFAPPLDPFGASGMKSTAEITEELQQQLKWYWDRFCGEMQNANYDVASQYIEQVRTQYTGPSAVDYPLDINKAAQVLADNMLVHLLNARYGNDSATVKHWPEADFRRVEDMFFNYTLEAFGTVTNDLRSIRACTATDRRGDEPSAPSLSDLVGRTAQSIENQRANRICFLRAHLDNRAKMRSYEKKFRRNQDQPKRPQITVDDLNRLLPAVRDGEAQSPYPERSAEETKPKTDYSKSDVPAPTPGPSHLQQLILGNSSEADITKALEKEKSTRATGGSSKGSRRRFRGGAKLNTMSQKTLSVMIRNALEKERDLDNAPGTISANERHASQKLWNTAAIMMSLRYLLANPTEMITEHAVKRPEQLVRLNSSHRNMFRKLVEAGALPLHLRLTTNECPEDHVKVVRPSFLTTLAQGYMMQLKDGRYCEKIRIADPDTQERYLPEGSTERMMKDVFGATREDKENRRRAAQGLPEVNKSSELQNSLIRTRTKEKLDLQVGLEKAAKKLSGLLRYISSAESNSAGTSTLAQWVTTNNIVLLLGSVCYANGVRVDADPKNESLVQVVNPSQDMINTYKMVVIDNSAAKDGLDSSDKKFWYPRQVPATGNDPLGLRNYILSRNGDVKLVEELDLIRLRRVVGKTTKTEILKILMALALQIHKLQTKSLRSLNL